MSSNIAMQLLLTVDNLGKYYGDLCACDRIDPFPQTFPSEMQQRLQLARILVTRPHHPYTQLLVNATLVP
ncbi:MAG: hypothetical protein F6K16_36475 [Symploca sp. SIO2B6]|nr:hypothetical protein [Symploca sp. SIO2B6]